MEELLGSVSLHLTASLTGLRDAYKISKAPSDVPSWLEGQRLHLVPDPFLGSSPPGFLDAMK